MNNTTHSSSGFDNTIIVDLTIASFVVIINALTVAVTTFMNSTREKVTLVIASLSVADALVGFARIIRYIAYTDERFLESCHFGAGILASISTYFPSSASQWHVVVLSVDRYLAVQYALTYSSMVTPLRLKLMVLSAWVLGFILTIITFTFHQLDCIHKDETDTYEFVRRILPVCVLCMIMMINSVIYAKLWLIARKHRRSISNMESRFHTGLQSVTSNKANVMVLIIVVLFMILWSPYVVTTIIVLSSTGSVFEQASRAQEYVSVLGYANSVLNSIVYVALNKEVRTAVKRTCTCKQ